jgi:hypothetical protein
LNREVGTRTPYTITEVVMLLKRLTEQVEQIADGRWTLKRRIGWEPNSLKFCWKSVEIRLAIENDNTNTLVGIASACLRLLSDHSTGYIVGHKSGGADVTLSFLRRRTSIQPFGGSQSFVQLPQSNNVANRSLVRVPALSDKIYWCFGFAPSRLLMPDAVPEQERKTAAWIPLDYHKNGNKLACIPAEPPARMCLPKKGGTTFVCISARLSFDAALLVGVCRFLYGEVRT